MSVLIIESVESQFKIGQTFKILNDFSKKWITYTIEEVKRWSPTENVLAMRNDVGGLHDHFEDSVSEMLQNGKCELVNS